MTIRLLTERTFRRTPGVHFADIHVVGSNGTDLVEHSGPSVSPPNGRFGLKNWYVHRHQWDYNRVLQGYRLFELYNTDWDDPHWFVFLTPCSGALEIPPGCLHRSYSGVDGSLLINQAVRTELYDENTEFIPVYSPFFGLADWAPACYHDCTPQGVAHFKSTGEIL